MSKPNRIVQIEELPDGQFLVSSNFEPNGEVHEMRHREGHSAARYACETGAYLFTEEPEPPPPFIPPARPPRAPRLEPGDPDYMPF